MFPMKTTSDTPLPRPRMKKAKNIHTTWKYNLNFNKWEMNTYENRSKAL